LSFWSVISLHGGFIKQGAHGETRRVSYFLL
jgi:hypothetical protein